MFSLRDAFDWVAGARLLGDGATGITSVCTDTRAIAPGALFVALRGERFDAHDFLAQAFGAGAAAAVVERAPTRPAGPLLVVEDSRRALGEIAAGWRRRFSLPLIAVTGSNGKTTVKEMIASILARAFGESSRLATAGNLNNEIGVPMTVFRLAPAHRAAVLELGMNRPGEIAWLARIAAPTIALVNNAQREHQEFMGSVRATALENGEAIRALPADGIAVFPGDDPHTPLWLSMAQSRRCLRFGFSDDCEIAAPADAQPAGFEMRLGSRRIAIGLTIAGAHNVRNALAAAACARALGLSPEVIADGLAAFRPVQGRLACGLSRAGARLIDDSYNANPDSVLAAIDVLAAAPAPQVLILGDMGEVGEEGPRYHREVVEYAVHRGIPRLLGLGQAIGTAVREAAHPGFEAFESIEPLLARATELAVAPATVLVKGSRFMRMERVVAALSGTVPVGAH